MNGKIQEYPELTLATAILAQAARDYYRAVHSDDGQFTTYGGEKISVQELNEFFDSAWFDTLSIGIDPDDFRRKARKYRG